MGPYGAYALRGTENERNLALIPEGHDGRDRVQKSPRLNVLTRRNTHLTLQAHHTRRVAWYTVPSDTRPALSLQDTHKAPAPRRRELHARVASLASKGYDSSSAKTSMNLTTLGKGGGATVEVRPAGVLRSRSTPNRVRT